MQPSKSVGPPLSSSSFPSPPPAAAWAIVRPAGHSPPPAPPPPAAAPPPAPPPAVDPLPLVDPEPDVEPELEAAGVVSLAATLTPTPIRPFIPAAAWPATEHRNAYLPLLVRVTVRVADSLRFSCFVFLPMQLFDARETGFRQILKSW